MTPDSITSLQRKSVSSFLFCLICFGSLRFPTVIYGQLSSGPTRASRLGWGLDWASATLWFSLISNILAEACTASHAAPGFLYDFSNHHTVWPLGKLVGASNSDKISSSQECFALVNNYSYCIKNSLEMASVCPNLVFVWSCLEDWRSLKSIWTYALGLCALKFLQITLLSHIFAQQK